MALLKFKPRTRLWVGKKTLEWMRVRAQLKRKFAAMGITSCELKYEGCWGTEALGFMHLKKRRHLKPEELEIAALGCGPCHARVEALPEAAMTAILESVISERGITHDR